MIEKNATFYIKLVCNSLHWIGGCCERLEFSSGQLLAEITNWPLKLVSLKFGKENAYLFFCNNANGTGFMVPTTASCGTGGVGVEEVDGATTGASAVSSDNSIAPSSRSIATGDG